MRTPFTLALLATGLAAQETWTTVHGVPTASADLRMCWHDADQRTVAVALSWGRTTLETWERVDGDWHQRRPATSPSARQGYQIVYDADRRVVVLFGGYQQGNLLNETWEWDGIDWRLRTPLHSPSPRTTSMVYDRAHGVTRIFGGGAVPDFWQWDGVDWQQVPMTAPSPAVLGGGPMVFDESRGVVVMFGGASTVIHDDIWEYDGTAWTRFTPALRPPPLSGSALAYDRSQGLTLLHGGFHGLTYNHDVWAWNGQNWTRRPAPAVHPGDTANASLIQNGLSQRLVLRDGTHAKQGTWEYDGVTNTWQHEPFESPSFSQGATACSDATGNIAVLAQGGFHLWRTATLDWQVAPPGPLPPSATAPSMCFDHVHQRMIWCGKQGTRIDTWTMDPTTMQWQQRMPPATPPGWLGATIAFDPQGPGAILFGGVDFVGQVSVVSDETWRWDGTTWTQLSPTNTPPRRFSAAMAYDWLTNRVVMFGGSNDNGVLDDVWEWDGIDWTQRQMSPGPGPTQGAVIGARQDGLLVAGGTGASYYRHELWALRGNQWVQLADEGMPVPGNHLGAVDFQTEDLYAFTRGGVVRWGAPPASATPVGFGCAGSNGVPELTISPLPTAGQPSILTTANTAANTVVAFAFSTAGQRIDLAGDCRAFLQPPFTSFAAFANANGSADLTLPIPNNLALVGFDLWAQAVALDATTGYALSNALRLRVGKP